MAEDSSEKRGLPAVILEGIDEYEGLLQTMPLIGKAYKVYRWVHRRRLEGFLQALDYEIGREGDSARERLDQLLGSEEGAEVLADFAATAVRNSSRTVGAALAVLYTDTDHATYNVEVKAGLCQAVDGMSDRLVEMFLALTEVETSDLAHGEQDEFPVYHLDNLLVRNPSIKTIAPTVAEQTAMVEDLQGRGLLLRERASRWGGPGGSSITYGFGPLTGHARRVLRRAKGVLKERPDQASYSP